MGNPAVAAEVERVAERGGSPKAARRVVGPGCAAKRARWAWSSCIKSRNAIIMVAMMARPWNAVPWSHSAGHMTQRDTEPCAANAAWTARVHLREW